MVKTLPQNFYKQNTLTVAQQLLGKYLVRIYDGGKIVGRITETEAYCGSKDLACHASRGRTPRTETLFGPPGYWYTYLIYGMYYCLNIVTEEKDYPAAVLIRAIEIVHPKNLSAKTDGPGKLCRAMHIDKTTNATPGFNSAQKSTLYIEDRGEEISLRHIKKTPRIGVDYAGKYKDRPWRFILNDQKIPKH